jgi:hypothetical protein
MQNSRLYLFLALIMVISLAVVSGCAKPAPAPVAPEPSAPSSPAVIPAPVTPAVTGSPDLVITKIWLDQSMIYYVIKNIGTADSPQTFTHIFVNDLYPAMGGEALVDVLKPGQEKTVNLSNYQWPYKQDYGEGAVSVNASGYIEPNLQNYKVKLCADATNVAKEAIETNNCKVTLLGIMWEYDLLTMANLAAWRNSSFETVVPGAENSAEGAHFSIPNADMEVIPQLETVPQQIPQGWIQGTWGYFYSDRDYQSPRSAAIKVPAKLHFIARVGLARNTTGTDGVTFKFGVKDLNDTVTWVASKKMSTPGAFEDWDVNLTDYEGQKLFVILRVDAGASPVNDFAIWNKAKLIQVND